jgi:TolB-like protein
VSVTFVLLLAFPAAAERERVVVLELSASDPKLVALAKSITEQVQTELGHDGAIEVVGASDLALALGVERQKELVGCGEGSNTCMAEISQALGAPWLVSGSLSRSGDAMRLDLKLIRTANAKAQYRGGRAFKGEANVFDVVSVLSRELAAELTPRGETRVGPWVLMGSGVAAGAVGAVLTVKAANDGAAGTMAGAANGKTAAQVLEAQRSANTLMVVGPAVAGVGVAALITGVVWLASGKPAPATVGLVVSPSGLTATMGGSF